MSEPLTGGTEHIVSALPGVSEAVRALVVAIDEVDDAEHELDLRVRARFGVHHTDLAALQYVDRVTRRGRTARASDLAQRFGISSGSATEVVNRLERAELVNRVRDAADGRNRTIVLTSTATERLDELVGDIRSNLNALLQLISEQEETRLIELLHAVRDIFRESGTDDDRVTTPRSA